MNRRLRQYPALWLAVAGVALVYGLGSYLAFLAVQGLVGAAVVAAQRREWAELAITFSLSSGLAEATLVVVALAQLLSPDEGQLRRVLGFLPVTAAQRRLGSILPGLLLLSMSLVAMWAPMLVAFGVAGLRPVGQLLAVGVATIVAFAVVVLAVIQAAHYAVVRIFGPDRLAARSVAMPLVIVAGLSMQTLAALAGEQALLSRSRPGWLWADPAYWTTLALGSSIGDVLVGLALLLGTAALAFAAYIALLSASSRVISGTTGIWTPLRWLPFGPNQLAACCAYEMKAMARDQNLLLSLVLVAGLMVLAGIAEAALFADYGGILNSLVFAVATLMGTLLLCTMAQSSWGRDAEQRLVLAVTPLDPQLLVVAKVATNLVVVTAAWLVLVGGYALFEGQPAALQPLLPIVLLGTLIAFAIGVILPSSDRDPLGMMAATAVFVTLGLPLQFLVQQIDSFLRNGLHLSGSAMAVLQAFAGAVIAAGSVGLIIQLDRARLRRDRA
jgi:hypothetical protein